jgi:DNA (cytosine-5)-methyltransferase 1
MRTVAFCEIEPYCRAVLRKHWPDVPIFEDVRNLRAEHVGPVDVICGGFPCQDISLAGKGAGLAGERSGLWSEYRRLIDECQPSWVVIENVSALRSRGLETVLGELSALGYDAEWHCIPASAVGAPHRRDRVWIVANSNGIGTHGGRAQGAGRDEPADSGADVAHAGCLSAQVPAARQQPAEQEPGGAGEDRTAHEGRPADDAMRGRHGAPQLVLCPGRDRLELSDWWAAEPDVGRVANGVPSRVDRLRALGNAVVPQIPELIGRAILAAEGIR